MKSSLINTHSSLGMNVNQHEMPSDMLLPSDSSYLFAFTVETEYCAMALWTIIAHIDKPVGFEE